MQPLTIYLWLLYEDHMDCTIVEDIIAIYPIKSNKKSAIKNIWCSGLSLTDKVLLSKAVFEHYVIMMKNTEKVWLYTDTHKIRLELNIKARDTYKISRKEIREAIDKIDTVNPYTHMLT